MSDLSKQAEIRGCYCGVWDKNPKAFKEKGLEYGYCGVCQRCGAPGHTRHFPGAAPYTGSWCNKHYEMTKWLHPQGAIGCFIWIAGTFVSVSAVWWLASYLMSFI